MPKALDVPNYTPTTFTERKDFWKRAENQAAVELAKLLKAERDAADELRAELHETQEAVTYWRDICARKNERIHSLIFWTAGFTAAALVAIVAAIRW